MLVGAGLMFVLMHGEVSADDYKKMHCEPFESDQMMDFKVKRVSYCKIKNLTCVFRGGGASPGVSCVKTEG